MTRIPSSLVRLSYRFHLSDFIAGAVAPGLAVQLRELRYFARHDLEGIIVYTAVATGATVFALLYFQVGQILSRFLSTTDIIRILKAAAGAALITAGIVFSLMRLDGIPRSGDPLHPALGATDRKPRADG
ncbi:MAG: hypothetical protein JWM36_10 [Hyphomicrobiales bacterium]|nr:hypothetical protein [Hyphomicrobiales bacterium]